MVGGSNVKTIFPEAWFEVPDGVHGVAHGRSGTLLRFRCGRGKCCETGSIKPTTATTNNRPEIFNNNNIIITLLQISIFK